MMERKARHYGRKRMTKDSFPRLGWGGNYPWLLQQILFQPWLPLILTLMGIPIVKSTRYRHSSATPVHFPAFLFFIYKHTQSQSNSIVLSVLWLRMPLICYLSLEAEQQFCFLRIDLLIPQSTCLAAKLFTMQAVTTGNTLKL